MGEAARWLPNEGGKDMPAKAVSRWILETEQPDGSAYLFGTYSTERAAERAARDIETELGVSIYEAGI